MPDPNEPPALLPSYTYHNAWLLLQFYKYTGDRKFLARIPDAIQWLEDTRLPQNETDGSRYTNPTFIEMGTNKAIYTHRSAEMLQMDIIGGIIKMKILFLHLW